MCLGLGTTNVLAIQYHIPLLQNIADPFVKQAFYPVFGKSGHRGNKCYDGGYY